MHPADITAALKKAGTSQTAVARDAGVSQAAVWMVIAGQRTSRRVAEAIATAVGMSVEKLWPGRYSFDLSSSYELAAYSHGRHVYLHYVPAPVDDQPRRAA